MNCPNCSTDVKESSLNPGVYVCRCLGYVEELTAIAKKVGQPQSPASNGNYELRHLSDVNQVVAVGKELRNAVSLPHHAQDYMSKGKLFGVYKDNKANYLVWITFSDKLIPGGNYFGKYLNAEPNEQDRIVFRDITKRLITQGELDPKIFSTADSRVVFFMTP